MSWWFHKLKGVRRKTLFLLLCLIALFKPASKSAEWSVESAMSAKEGVNDNLQMTADPHPAVRENTISPSVNMGMELENWALNGLASLTANHFDGQNEFDSLDQNFNILTRFDTSERTSWSLKGGYLIDSTLGDELTRTGVVLERTQRNIGSVSLNWKRSLFEKSYLNVSYEWSHAGYVDPAPGLYNYQVDFGTAGITHELNEKSEVNGNVSYSVYHIPDQNTLSWDAGIRAGWIYSFSESLKGTLSGGFHRTGSSFTLLGVDSQTFDSGWVLNGDLAYQMEQLRIHGALSREVQISGGGSLVQVDRLSGDLGYPVTERANVSLGLVLYRTDPFRKDLASLKSQYGQIRCGWNWQWMERWELGLGYSYSTQSSDALPQVVSSNAGYFTMTYTTPKWSLSR